MPSFPQLALDLSEWVHQGRCAIQDLEFYEGFNEQYQPSDWTRNPASNDLLGTFAQDGAGGQYALYLQAEGSPPVVKLGDDGEVLVLAKDLADFAYLLACGVEPISLREGSAQEWSGELQEEMRAWLEELEPGRDWGSPADVLARAAKAWPGLVEEVRAQVQG